MFELEPTNDASDSFSYYSDGSADHVSPNEETPITAPADWNAEDNPPEASDVPPLTEESEPPFTIVEIGSGGSPILTSPAAPDIAKLYEHGGKYVGVDANVTNLSRGAETTDFYREAYLSPDTELDISFVHASIETDQPLPDTLEADMADRVIISNVLTDPRVARHPDTRQAIAHTAFSLVRKEPPGEVVMVGTITPRIFSAEAVEALLTAAGLEYVSSDDVGAYVPEQYKKDRELMYVDRYRPQTTLEESNDTSVATETGRDVETPAQDPDDEARRRRQT